MRLYSKSLSAIATISSLILSKIIPALFSCRNNFNLSQISLGFSGKNIAELPEAMIAGDLRIPIRDLFLLFFYPKLIYQNTFLLQNRN